MLILHLLTLEFDLIQIPIPIQINFKSESTITEVRSTCYITLKLNPSLQSHLDCKHIDKYIANILQNILQTY